MSPLFYGLLGALAMSLLSLIGILVLPFKDKAPNKIIFFLVSFSTGALLGGAFFHLLPETLEEFNNPDLIFGMVLIGFMLFFILERLFRWHHCHEIDCAVHPRHLGYLNLAGDALHNMLDGLIIISSFTISPALGLPVLASLALHEIPQEIGDYGVLLYAGFSRGRALLYNLISALFAVVGVIIGYYLINSLDNINNFLLPLAAGGFIYIAASDLIPELHKERDLKKSLLSFLFFALALLLMLFTVHK